MNNKQVAHLWANKSLQSAKGSHFYFEGDTIYSYGSHFPIARHYKGVVLFTTASYSNTTARHISITRQACNHLTCYFVSDVRRDPCGKDVKEYAAEIEVLSGNLARARDPQWKLEALQRKIAEANGFCERFGYAARFFEPSGEELAALKVKAQAEAKRKANATAARNARIKAEQAETVAKWLAGERVSIPYNVQTVYLRAKAASDFSAQGQSKLVLETSRGASVPLADAQRAFQFIWNRRRTGWHRNGETCRVGDFQLDAVKDQGIVAGCHRISWPEIERFALSQGWITQALVDDYKTVAA